MRVHLGNMPTLSTASGPSLDKPNGKVTSALMRKSKRTQSGKLVITFAACRGDICDSTV